MTRSKKNLPSKRLFIVSGGQTGVDRAALDVALELGFPCGGWCPQGRLAEDGSLPARYPLRETPSADYVQRTEWNVRDSDATLILAPGTLRGGTAFTRKKALALKKPVRVVKLSVPDALETVMLWLTQTGIRRLNVAGPRESQAPGIYDRARRVLNELFCTLIDS